MFVDSAVYKKFLWHQAQCKPAPMLNTFFVLNSYLLLRQWLLDLKTGIRNNRLRPFVIPLLSTATAFDAFVVFVGVKLVA
jgi:hypothetical protein